MIKVHAGMIAIAAVLFAAQAGAQSASTDETVQAQPAPNQMASNTTSEETAPANARPCEGTECLQRPAITTESSLAANPAANTGDGLTVARANTKKDTGVTVEALPPLSTQ